MAKALDADSTSQKQQDQLMQQEDDTVQRVNDPTAEEAQRTADQLNTPPDRDEPPAAPEGKKTKEDPRKAMVEGYRTRKREESRAYITGEMNNPELAAGKDAVVNTRGEGEGEPEPSLTADQRQEQPPAQAQPGDPGQQKIRLQIDGQIREFTLDEVRTLAQKNGSADLALQEAAQIRRDALEFAKTVRGETPPIEADRRADQQDGDERPIPTRQAAPSSQTGPTDEELATVFNSLQIGSEQEGVQALRGLIQKVAPPQQPVDVREAVNGVLAERDEQQSFTGATQEFLKQYPNLDKHPDVKVLLAAGVETEYVKDLLSAGVPPDSISKLNSTTLREAHKILRRDPLTKSFTRTPDKILAAVAQMPTFKALAPLLKGPAPPLNVTVDRSARKEGVQQQPAQRTVPPRLPSSQQQPAGDRHAAAVRKAQEARGQRVVS